MVDLNGGEDGQLLCREVDLANTDEFIDANNNISSKKKGKHRQGVCK